MDHIHDIYSNAVAFEMARFRPRHCHFVGHLRGLVWFYAQGCDVVFTDKSEQFRNGFKGRHRYKR
jgi:hypothetical protein